MSKKSKHHKPKGPRNPPQDQPQVQEQPEEQQLPEPSQQIPEPPQVIQEIKPVAAPEPKPETKSENKPKQPSTESAPSSSTETPIKPKRNRGKKNKKQSEGPDNAEEEIETVSEETKPKPEQAKKAEKPAQPPPEVKATESAEKPKQEQGESKNKKKNKNKGTQHVEAASPAPVSEVPAVPKNQEPEVKVVEQKAEKPKEVIKKPEVSDDADAENKSNKNKKSKNKKNKETQSTEPAKVSESASESVEIKPEVKPAVEKKEATKVEDKPEHDEGKSKNKKNKKDKHESKNDIKSETPASPLPEKKSPALIPKPEEKKSQATKIDEPAIPVVKEEKKKPASEPVVKEEKKKPASESVVKEQKKKPVAEPAVKAEEKKPIIEPAVKEAENKPVSEPAVKEEDKKVIIKPAIKEEIKETGVKVEEKLNKPLVEIIAHEEKKKSKDKHHKGKTEVVEKTEVLPKVEEKLQAEVVKVEEKPIPKEEKAPEAPTPIKEKESCPFVVDDKPKVKAENLDDDILPSLASSIEKTLEELIVCESDIVLDEQLKLKEKEQSKKKAEKEGKKKKGEKPEVKQETKQVIEVPKQVPEKVEPEKKIEKQEIKVEEQIKKEEVVDISKKIDTDIKMEKVIETPVVVPVHDNKSDPVCRLQAEESRKSKSPSRKSKKGQKPGKSEDKSESPKTDVTLTAPVVGETPAADKSICKTQVTEPDTIVTVPIIESEPKIDAGTPIECKKSDEMNIKSSVPEEIIKQLLSDTPPPPVVEEVKKDIKIEELLPIAKSPTVLEDIPKCAVEKPQVDESKKIEEAPKPVDEKKEESSLEKEMKKALEVAVGVIISNMPPIQEMPHALIPSAAEVKEKVEECKGSPKSKKSKKHEKKAEQPHKEEVEVKDAKIEPKKQAEIVQHKEEAPKSSVEEKKEESAKASDSPKPTKRNKDKKGKGGKGGEGSKTTQGTQQSTASSQESSQQSSDKKQEESKKSDEKKQSGESKDSKQKDSSSEQKEAPDSGEHKSKCVVAKTDDTFEFLKIPDSALRNVDDQSRSVDKNKQRKSPPKATQPKNLLGPSSMPAKSNKLDYKKEKNKGEEMDEDEFAKIKMRNLEKADMPELLENDKSKKSILPEELPATQSKGKIIEYDVKNSDDEDGDEFVYKYSFRTVFIANACHTCKLPLKDDRIVCRFCHLVGYCNEKHRDDDWTLHQSFCYAVSTLANAKGQTHIYEDAKSLNGHDYRLLRMQAIVSCEKMLKRKLCPWEQEALLYPRICSTSSCREWKTNLLKDCEGCGQISYCISDASHLISDHSKWCPSYKLYYKLVAHQLNHGRLEPQLPCKIPPEGYRLPDKSSSLFDDLYGNTASLDECHFATLTQLSTVPLTALYAYQKATEHKKAEKLLNGHANKAKNFIVHLIGAELQFEGDTLKKWESFFLHMMPDVKELTVVFIGPELNIAKLPVELLSKIKLCQFCRQTGRSVKFDFIEGTLYHDYVESEKFVKPDMICAFNPGFHRATGYAGLDTWPETIAAALRLNVPLCVSAYTAHEMPRDLERVKKCAPNQGQSLRVISPPALNPYTSLRPDRNFVSDDEMPLIFKNYHMMIVAC